MDTLWTSPWVVIPVLIMPVVIIGLAKAMKRLKDKKEAAPTESSTPQS
jgi:hypothetical protein